MAKLDFKSAVVGFSGGADSVCLLHMLAQNLNIKLIAVHVHHGLRGIEADEDADFCEQFCNEHGIDFLLMRANVKKVASEYKMSLEAAGRKLRYEIFEKVANEYGMEKIAVGHNKNDVAETALMQILRGTGQVTGIKGQMNNIVRPLINTTRKEIIDYCNKNDLAYKDDSTNFEKDFLRNKIRLDLIPELESVYNPKIIDALTRLAQTTQAEDDLLDQMADVSGAIDNVGEILIKQFENKHVALKRRIVRQALKKAIGTLDGISFPQIEDILGLECGKSGRSTSLPGGFIASRVYEKIVIEKYEIPEQFSTILPFDQEVYVPQAGMWFCIGKKLEKRGFTKELNCDKIKEITVRTRLPGDKIFFNGVGTKKIKDYFIDKKIPRNEREKAIFVACGENIIAIVNEAQSDYFDAPFDAPNDKKVYLQIWEGDFDGI